MTESLFLWSQKSELGGRKQSNIRGGRGQILEDSLMGKRSSQQLRAIRLGPLKGFLIWHGALQGLSSSPRVILPELLRHKDTWRFERATDSVCWTRKFLDFSLFRTLSPALPWTLFNPLQVSRHFCHTLFKLFSVALSLLHFLGVF